MATNRQLKAELLRRMKVTPQRLSQITRARIDQLPMTTEKAVYTIAHEHGIDIAKYLSSEETAEVRRLLVDLRSHSTQGASEKAATPARAPRGSTKKSTSVKIAGVDIGSIPVLHASHANEAKLMSEKVYPNVYIFENSVRDLIERVLSAEYGSDWWETAVPKTPRENAQEHLNAEKKDLWHSPRGRREIDYVFLNDLWAIIFDQWKLFAPLFPDQAWVKTIIARDMNVSRIVLAHMNPLAADEVMNIEAAFRKWVKQLRAVESQIP